MPDSKRSFLSLTLVIPPFIRPASPPLGPSSLKAFLKKKLPAADIKCLDLNLDYFYLAMKCLEEGSFKLRLYDWDHLKTSEKVRQAFVFLRSVTPTLENIREYHSQSTIFLSFENIFNAFMSEMALRTLTAAPVPPGVSSFFETLCAPLSAGPAELVGISVLFDVQMPMALLMAKMVREKSGAGVVLGGAKFGVEPSHGRLLLEPIVQKVKDSQYSVNAVDFIDGIISGEGEMALLHMMEKGNRDGFEDAPNLTVRKGNRVIHNPPAVIDALDTLPPPDFSDLSLDKYLCPERILPLLTARGCPWGKCVFCTHHHSYKRYRQRSVSRVVEDIRHLKEHYNVRFFNIFDEMIPPARFRKLAEGLTETGLDICYCAYGKPVKRFDRNTLEIIRDSGCRLILWGIESGSQRVLDLMNKGTKVDEVEKVIKTASEAGIKNLVFVMFGFPGETEEEFLQTLSFLENNRAAVHALSKGLFRLMDGSEVAGNPGAFGIEDIKEAKVPPFKSRLLTYQTAPALKPEQAEEFFKKNLTRIEAVGVTPRFGTYREHLLVYACRQA